MENDDLDEYEGIFDNDEVVDMLLYDKVERDFDKKKNTNNTGCFTMILAISGCGLFGILLILI